MLIGDLLDACWKDTVAVVAVDSIVVDTVVAVVVDTVAVVCVMMKHPLH